MPDDYSDIINLQHHVSLTHPHMSKSDRAAQFSPFAALTGFGKIIKETENTPIEDNFNTDTED